MKILREKTSAETKNETKPKIQKAAKQISSRRKKVKDVSLPDKVKQEKSHNRELGKRGENAAACFLERKGLNILDRNWSCSVGEVDIVAEDEETLIFIEVKTRSGCGKGLPEEAVTAQKRKRYERIAAFWLKDHEVTDRAIRFDVISILVIAPDRAFLRHHRDAFALGE